MFGSLLLFCEIEEDVLYDKRKSKSFVNESVVILNQIL